MPSRRRTDGWELFMADPGQGGPWSFQHTHFPHFLSQNRRECGQKGKTVGRETWKRGETMGPTVRAPGRECEGGGERNLGERDRPETEWIGE